MTDNKNQVICPESRMNFLVEKAEEALAQAEKFADQNGLHFNFSPAYAMGGSYYGHGDKDPNETNEWGDDQYGWHASSANC